MASNAEFQHMEDDTETTVEDETFDCVLKRILRVPVVSCGTRSMSSSGASIELCK